MKITPNSLSIAQMFSAANEQFIIPPYQRAYSWRARQINELLDDIELIDQTDTHLLGSIVCLTSSHTAGVNRLEIVDGQQRLTTLSIILECIKQRFILEEDAEQAGEIKRLLSAKALAGKSISKVALSSIDNADYITLVELDQDQDDSACTNRKLAEAFKLVRSWLSEKDLENINEFVYKLQNQAMIIRLDVSDAKDAFKLFEIINNRGLRLSPTDIIKNFVLGNAARFGAIKLERARTAWAQLILYLDGTDSDVFFRYLLISSLKQKVTTSQVVPKFKSFFMNNVLEAGRLPDRHLYLDNNYIYYASEEDDDGEDENDEDFEIEIEDDGQIDFEDFLKDVLLKAKVFGEIVLAKTDSKPVNRHLDNLRMIKASQTYGFLMHLRAGGISDKNFISVLKLTENLILRRHVCRERANDTETLFARICSVNAKQPLKEIVELYREATPSDERFLEEFANVNFTSNIIDRARYCLEQLELMKHGSYSEFKIHSGDLVHVEHIIPQKIKTRRAMNEFGDWLSYLGTRAEVQHSKYVSKIGNLTLFSGTLNIVASNNPFQSKKNAYIESGILMTKALCDMSQFKFKELEARSKELAEDALERWPIP